MNAAEAVTDPDWLVLVLAIVERPGDWYRFHVEGENLNYAPEAPGRRFCWSVPDVRSPRFAPHPDATQDACAALAAAKVAP